VVSQAFLFILPVVYINTQTTIMKKLLLLVALVCTITTFAQAQASEVKRTEEYCEMTAVQKPMSTKMMIGLDYGQETSLWKTDPDRTVRNDDGKIKNFNSVVDALNYMNSQGWEFVTAYVVTSGGQNAYRYLLKRKVA
jgi:hypothetical protein